ncbi:GMC family oxidoreductase [Neobacillus cucumis]|uniref:GMC family oxidoreductase n=1 Tax=Neobacillus cucumis TaxID=1740721 RepID=UPI0028531254|nr:GMC family oxidoreductase [Neobacillus cucumis]MDR4949825.1 GMC family oxidoreductase [Neobacillus cucumis]
MNVFDYIVIGAGTAGGIIAEKLSDDHRTSVLVLEAGTNMTEQFSNPNLFVALGNSTDNKFSFNVATRIEQTIGRQFITSSGRAIGGSSEHNAMFAVRGSRDLYDTWANLVDNPVWSYDSIRPLFKENETYTGESQKPQERGHNGPIFIRQQNIPENIPNPGLIQTLTKATHQVFDIPIKEDYNTGIRDVVSPKGQFTQKMENGKLVRSSVATGYLNSHVVTQGNEFNPDELGVNGRRLVILGKTTVNKVLFKQKHGDKIAVGVEFIKDGVSQTMFARKGIIVSAGQFSSVILQRSGIGKTDDLVKAGITPLVESPQVGYNFQTHFYVGMGVRVETSRLLDVMKADPNQPLTLKAFKKVDNPTGGRRLQLLGVPNSLFIPSQIVDINAWQFNENNKSNVMSIGIVDVNSRSRGTIMVAHSDPEAYPSIDLNPLPKSNLDDPDLNFMIDQYIETYKMIVKARELDKHGIYEVVYPDERIFKLDDENKKRAILADFVRASYSIFTHFGGQCKMAKDINSGVVNAFLDVFGTKNLKVADLSIAPILPDGNTSIPAQMIGLNAVRFIQDDPHPYVFDDAEFKDSYEESSDNLNHSHHHPPHDKSSDESSS